MLNKTEYLQYLSCPREYWLQKKYPDLFNEDSLEIQHLVDQGYEVEELVKSIFLGDDSIEFQKQFCIDGLYTRTDVFKLDAKNLDTSIFEIKSTSSLKDEHLDDLAFQKIVVEKTGIKVNKTYLIYLNSHYILEDTIEIAKLLVIEDVTEKVESIIDKTIKQIKEATEYLNSEPENSIVNHCSKKLDCEFIKYSHPNLPEYTIFDISNFTGKKKYELLEKGILNILDVPKDFKLSERQRLQVDIAQSKNIIIQTNEINKILESLEYPLYFLDYESFNPAIPMYKGIKPFQQMVFQFSLHIQYDKDSEIVHKEFLAKGDNVACRELVEALNEAIDEEGGTVIVWNKSFEESRNKELAILYPEFSEFLHSVNSRIFDLMIIFSQNLYSHPEFKGKYSIKKILPVLVPHLKYSDLEINQGTIASIKWYHMITNKTTTQEKEKIYSNLLEYCRMDTLGMVEIFNELKKL